jgi:hypothetical protein
VPVVDFESLTFCSQFSDLGMKKARPQKTLACNGEEPNVYKRISGCLFMSLPVEVTTNKMHLKDDLAEICSHGGPKWSLQDETTGKWRVTQKLEQEFVTWLNKMHSKYEMPTTQPAHQPRADELGR